MQRPCVMLSPDPLGILQEELAEGFLDCSHNTSKNIFNPRATLVHALYVSVYSLGVPETPKVVRRISMFNVRSVTLWWLEIVTVMIVAMKKGQ